MVPLVAIVVVMLALAAPAEGKITCEEPRDRARDVPLTGLPAEPVAERTYRVTATLRRDEGVNPAPHLGAIYCGDDAGHEAAAGAGGSFARRGAGVYVLELRFPQPGPWAASFMDRAGRFHELGMLAVRSGPWPAVPPLFRAVWWPQFSTK